MVCLKATAGANKLEQVQKEFFFREKSATLRKVVRGGHAGGAGGALESGLEKTVKKQRRQHIAPYRRPAAGPLEDFVPKSWTSGGRYEQKVETHTTN